MIVIIKNIVINLENTWNHNKHKVWTNYLLINKNSILYWSTYCNSSNVNYKQLMFAMAKEIVMKKGCGLLDQEKQYQQQ